MGEPLRCINFDKVLYMPGYFPIPIDIWYWCLFPTPGAAVAYPSSGEDPAPGSRNSRRPRIMQFRRETSEDDPEGSRSAKRSVSFAEK